MNDDARDALIARYVEALDQTLTHTTLIAYFAERTPENRFVVRWCTDGFTLLLGCQRTSVIGCLTIWDIVRIAKDLVEADARFVFELEQEELSYKAEAGRLPSADASTFMSIRGIRHRVLIHSDGVESDGVFLGRFVAAVVVPEPEKVSSASVAPPSANPPKRIGLTPE